MNDSLVIRDANEGDHEFILGLSPYLAEVASLDWHTDDAVRKMQDSYILEMLGNSSTSCATFIAEMDDQPQGFIHVRTHKDGISGEICGTVPLLAVSPGSQGSGMGKLLMEAAEEWVRSLGCRLLHLEVFANNAKANRFYQKLGFKPEILHMVKPI